jgi:hypothetical protein
MSNSTHKTHHDSNKLASPRRVVLSNAIAKILNYMGTCNFKKGIM